jgi:cytochrome c-type biogenesis protein CcmH/NrfG
MSGKVGIAVLGTWLLFGPVLSFSQAPVDTQQQIQAHAQRAQTFLREKRPDLALPELEFVVALDPHNVDAQGNLGVLLFFASKYADAIPHLRAALAQQPSLWRIQALLGLAEGRLGNTTASRGDLVNAFPHLDEAKIRDEVGRALIDNYRSTGDLEKAAATASILLTSEPTDTTLQYISYRLYSDLADTAMLTLALAAPESPQMHQVMARELARHGDRAAAIANYRAALKTDPKVPGLHLEFAEMLYNSPDDQLRKEAESELQAALAVNPHDEKAELMLGEIAAKHGDMEAAFRSESRALELDPGDGDACTELAKVLAAQGQNQKAGELFAHAIQIDPTNYVAHYRLSTIYRQEGKSEESKQELAQYRKYKEIKEKLQSLFHDMRVTAPASISMNDNDATK